MSGKMHSVLDSVVEAYFTGADVLGRIPLVGKRLGALAMVGGWFLLSGVAWAAQPQGSSDIVNVFKKALGLVILVITGASLVVGLGFLFSGFTALRKGDQGGYGGSPWMKILAGTALMGLTPLGYALFKYFWSGSSLHFTMPTNPEDIIQESQSGQFGP